MKNFVFGILSVLATTFVFGQEIPKGLAIHQRAPNFTAVDQNGKKFVLSDALKKGPVVLVFYRGEWCPYCNKQLKKLEDSLVFIQQKSATLIAVTPEKPENITKTIGKTKASYPILFDDGLTIMKAYGVAFKIDSSSVLKYKNYGIDFAVQNGSNGANLPIPAVYIINKQGVIIYRHFDADYKKRASVNEILSNL